MLADGAKTAGGRRYAAPHDVLVGLENVFAEPGLDRIEVIYRPIYVRSHLVLVGGWSGSVTRPGRIYTTLAERVFFALDAHVLHEYFHVVEQWGRERMTRLGYLSACRRKEREAADFVAANLARYRRLRAAARSAFKRPT